MMNRVNLRNVFLVIAVSLAVCSSAVADSILHDFKGDDGFFPLSAVTLDTAGNLYGTTFQGGPGGKGTVYELSLNPDGTRTFTMLHSFPDFTGDGVNPSSGVTVDSNGNVYGVTAATSDDSGTGIVYQLSPSQGTWKYNVVHTFSRRNGDGVMPHTALVVDASGNLYGATLKGGTSDQGVIFQLSLPRGGSWEEKIIYNFPKNTAPQGIADIVMGSDGTLYVSRFTGGANGSGVLFALSSSDGKTWTSAILHNFGIRGSGDPAYPSGIALDASGNIFGVSSYGGAEDQGSLFELPRNSNGSFGPLRRIYSFKGRPDGTLPVGSPFVDAQGNVYGTTLGGGTSGVLGGIVYKFSPSGSKWTGKVLHNFSGKPDGNRPAAGPIVDGDGNVYGTASSGGASQGGVVWELTP
jgi:uncharacterized repeat protein (TIGR03803 family)